MAFHTNSRYADEPTVEATLRGGVVVTAVKLRSLPSPSATEIAVRPQDRPDLLAFEHFSDSTRFWHVADANTELEAARLCARVSPDAVRVIQVPRSA